MIENHILVQDVKIYPLSQGFETILACRYHVRIRAIQTLSAQNGHYKFRNA
jgi:hypothetical protein